MRQPPEFFGEEELDLLYIGKKLKASQQIEAALDAAGIEYAIEVDYYLGGLIFRSLRAGAFFYVRPADHERSAGVLRAQGVEPQPRPEEEAGAKS